MKNVNGKELGNYIIHGMLIAQLFALIAIELVETSEMRKDEFSCKSNATADQIICSKI